MSLALPSLALSPRGRLAAGLAALGALVMLAAVPGDLAPVAARAGLAAALLAALAALARRRGMEAAAPSRLDVVARTPLGRDGGLALVEADGRRLVVAFGDGGARLVADLGERMAERSP